MERREKAGWTQLASVPSNVVACRLIALLLFVVTMEGGVGHVAAQSCADVPTSYYLDPSGQYRTTYDTIQGWYKNRTTWYWTFGPRSTAAGPPSDPGSVVLAAPIWVPFYPNGTKAGNNIIDVLPCQPRYSDLWLVVLLTVPANKPLNFYKDAATVQRDAGSGTVKLMTPGATRNCPVVTFNSTIVDTNSPNPDVASSLPAPVFGWYRGEQVFYFDFGPVSSPRTMFVWQVLTKSGMPEGQNLINVVPEDPGYTPFWQLATVTVLDGTPLNSVRSKYIAEKYSINSTANIVNCPVAFTSPPPSLPNCTVLPAEQYLNASGLLAFEFDTVQGWFQNQSTWYWDFGPRSTPSGPASSPSSMVLAAPIWVPVYQNGSKAGNNIIDVLPCQQQYSDLWLVVLVTVSNSTAFSYYRSAAAVQKAAAAGAVTLSKPGLMVNCPVVPFNSTVTDTNSPNPNISATLPNPIFGWYRNSSVFYFDFGHVGTTITQPVWKVQTQLGVAEGLNIINVIPGQAGYTPFWELTIVTVPDALSGNSLVDSNSITSAQLAAAYPQSKPGLVVNCPVAYTAGGVGNTSGGNSSAGAIGGCSVSFMGQAQSFPHCLFLDSANSFQLAWRPGSSPGTTTVLFTATAEAAYGWAAWGVSPDGLMPGTDAIIGLGDSSNSATTLAGQYHNNQYMPTRVALGASLGSGHLIDAVPSSLALLFSNGGKTVQTMVDVTGLDSGPVYVVWKTGPSGDVSSGTLVPHSDLSRVSRQIDFLSGSAGGVDSTTSHHSQKLAHAFLAAIGFGILLPIGILVARHVKLWAGPLWYYTHIGLQISGYLVGVVGWSIGIWLKTQFGDLSLAPSYQQDHFKIGVAIFCSSTLQILTPILKPHKGTPVRLYWNLVHWSLGYSTVILSFVNIFFGFSVISNENVPIAGWRTAYIVLLSVWGALLVLLEPLSWYMFWQKQKLEKDAIPVATKGVPDVDGA